MDFYQRDYLHIFSRDVLKKIAAGDEEWEKMVPPEVAEIIKERGYFGYRAVETTTEDTKNTEDF